MKDDYNRNKHKYTPMSEESKIKISEGIGGTDEENIKLFKSLPFYNNEDVFEKVWCKNKDGTNRSYWVFTCSICAKDRYAQDGCSSSLKTSKQYLKGKKKMCRCAPDHKFTKEEKGYNLKWMCQEEGITFLGWVYEDTSQYFRWICKNGHETSCRVSSFVNEGRRCRYCRDDANGINGYYKDKVDFEDFLYVLKFKDFIKIGRSFNVKSRVHYIKQVSKEKPTLVTLYTSDHQSTYDTEQIFLGILRGMGFQVYLDWTNECFELEALDVVLKLLDEQNTLIKYK